jgi:hypothetical protein
MDVGDKFKNIKNGRTYEVVHPFVVNATNSANSEGMVLYKDLEGVLYVRSIEEFLLKFAEA